MWAKALAWEPRDKDFLRNHPDGSRKPVHKKSPPPSFKLLSAFWMDGVCSADGFIHRKKKLVFCLIPVALKTTP